MHKMFLMYKIFVYLMIIWIYLDGTKLLKARDSIGIARNSLNNKTKKPCEPINRHQFTRIASVNNNTSSSNAGQVPAAGVVEAMRKVLCILMLELL